MTSIHEDGMRHGRQVSGQQGWSVERLLFHLGIVLGILSIVSAAVVALGQEAVLKPWLWISPAVLCVACIVTAFCIIRAEIPMVASPLVWVLLASGVYWGFGPLIYTFGDRSAISQLDDHYAIDPSHLFRTNLLNSVGTLALLVGLVVGRRLVARRPLNWMRRLEGMDALRVAGVLAVVGLAAKCALVLPVMFGLIGTQSYTILALQVLSTAALMILSYLSVTRGGRASVLFALLLVVEIAISILVAAKLAILEVVIATLVGRTLGVRKTSTAVKGFVLLAFLLLVLQPVVASYRFMKGDSIEADYASAAAVAGTLMAQSLSDLLNGYNVAQESLPQGWWLRLCYTPQQAFAMDEYDSARPGNVWKDFATTLIPRVLWHDKPLITPGKDFSVLMSGNELNNDAPGVLGEGYWCGGWIGLLLVGLYAGLFLGAIGQVSMKAIENRAWVFIPLVCIGIRNGIRIDGRFSTEYLFGSVWYVLSAVSMYYGSICCLHIWRARLVTSLRTRVSAIARTGP